MVLERKSIIFSILCIIAFSSSIHAFGEVETLHSDKSNYKNGDTLTFSGKVSSDSSGLVTIVIRDPNDKFVLLSQAVISHDNSFLKDVATNEKFQIPGVYNATAFISNMTAGAKTSFNFGNNVIVNPPKPIQIESKDNSQKNEPMQNVNEKEKGKKIADFVDPKKDPQHYLDRYYSEIEYQNWFHRNYPEITIEEAVGLSDKQDENPQSKISNFPDPEKDPQYYIDRYNNEKAYRDWFDRNFPGKTIFEVVGIPNPENVAELPTKEQNQEFLPIKQEASAMVLDSTVSPTKSDSSELSQIVLAIGGLGVLFGAVYGIKRKVDNNSEQIRKNKNFIQKRVEKNIAQISKNRFWIKKKLNNFKNSEEPLELIKKRLAKGDINLDEYYRLFRAIKKE